MRNTLEMFGHAGSGLNTVVNLKEDNIERIVKISFFGINLGIDE